MLTRAAAELSLDLARSWVVGDSVRDLEAGAALGIPGVLVGTGKGREQRPQLSAVGPPAPIFVEDLNAAAEHIVAASLQDQGR